MFQTTNQMMFMCSDGIKSTINSLMVEYGLRDDPTSLKMICFWLGFWGAENITPQSSKLGSPKLHWPNCSFDAETRFTLDSNPKSIEPANHPTAAVHSGDQFHIAKWLDRWFIPLRR